MKARAVVFTHTQYPDTIFGLPRLMVVLVVGVSVLVLVVMFAVGIFVAQIAIALALIGFVVTLAAGLVLAWRVGRTDRHVESLYLTSAKFWRGTSRRWLLAGAAPVSSPRGGRS